MDIITYDKKDKATYDLARIAEYLSETKNYREDEMEREIAEKRAYYEGYRDALYNIKRALEISNYRVDTEKG